MTPDNAAMTELKDPWEVHPDAFPAEDSLETKLRFLLNYAVLAPSGHNTQPWMFRVESDTVTILADKSRALPVVDPQNRALTMSCAAAAETLMLAARQYGLLTRLTPLPDGPDADTIALVHCHHGDIAPESWAVLEAIRARRTTRKTFDPRPLPQTLRTTCVDLAKELGVAVVFAGDGATREKIAELVAEGDRRQFEDSAFRNELADWIRPRKSDSHDGLSGISFGMPDPLSGLGSLVIRTFDLGGTAANGDARKIREGSPALAVIATQGDTPADWVAAGRALTRVLVRLSSEGWTASYLNQPIEVPALRPQLRDALGIDAHPQLLLRIGQADLPPPAARRPVSEVLIAG